jgi:hypothetical protein
MRDIANFKQILAVGNIQKSYPPPDPIFGSKRQETKLSFC